MDYIPLQTQEILKKTLFQINKKKNFFLNIWNTPKIFLWKNTFEGRPHTLKRELRVQLVLNILVLIELNLEYLNNSN